LGILSGLRRGRDPSGETASADPVVDAITRSVMRRSGRLPETYLARLMTGSFDAEIPSDKASREAWVRSHVASAFDPQRGQAISDAFARKAPGIGAAIDASVREGAVAWFEKASNATLMGRDLPGMVDTVRSYTANRVVDFMKPGRRLAMRVSREASALRQAKDETVLDRLAEAPRSRLDPLPPSGRERTDWIRERLLAEYVSARGGVMSPDAVVAASERPRGPVPTHDLSEMPFVREDERSRVRAGVREDMVRETGMSDPVLRSRHAGVPGIAAMEIPSAGRARNQAVAHILMAEIVRSEMRRQDMIVAPRREKPIPREAQTIVRYAPRSRGLGTVGRETVDARPSVAPAPIEKAAVPMGGDRVSASRRYSDMVRKATGSYDF
jgi:hypothetical protein